MKPYVICHMMPSVDGRLRTERWNVSEEFASGHWKGSSHRAGKRLQRTDWVAPAAAKSGQTFGICLDPKGAGVSD